MRRRRRGGQDGSSSVLVKPAAAAEGGRSVSEMMEMYRKSMENARLDPRFEAERLVGVEEEEEEGGKGGRIVGVRSSWKTFTWNP